MRSMMDPNNLRAVMQMQQSLQQLSGSGLMPGVPPMGGSAPPPPAGGLDFSSLLGSSGGTPAAAQPMANPFMFPFMPPAAGQQPGNAASTIGSASPQQAPGQRFRQQLQNLNDMGFTDRSANIRALTSSHGNVNRAIEILLESPPEMGESSSEPAPAADGEGEATAPSNDDTSGETSSDPKEATEKKND